MSKQDNIDRLDKRIKELESESYKDEELSKLKEEIERLNKLLNNGFHIDENTSANIDNWIKSHESEHGGDHGCCGGKYSYIFIPTSIGVFASVKCSCGAKYDFSEV